MKLAEYKGYKRNHGYGRWSYLYLGVGNKPAHVPFYYKATTTMNYSDLFVIWIGQVSFVKVVKR